MANMHCETPAVLECGDSSPLWTWPVKRQARLDAGGEEKAPMNRRTPKERARAIALLVLAWAIAHAATPAAGNAEEAGKYQGPCALVASRDGRTLYVACADACQVAWVELPGGRVVRRVDLPAEPTGLALSPDGARLIVACAAPKSTVAVLAAASGERLAAVRAGHTAVGPAVSPDGTRLYVCNRFDNDVSLIDLAAGREMARVPAVREPIAAAVTPDGREVLVANHLPIARTDDAFEGDVAAAVTVIDARTLHTSAIALRHGASSVRGLCVMPDGKHALVTHLLSNFQKTPFRVDMGWINTNVVSILDIQRRKVLRTIGMDEQGLGAGNPWDVTCTPDGSSVCVSLAGTHEACVIDSPTLLSESARTMAPMMGVWPIYTSLSTSLWRRIKLSGHGPRGLAAAGPRVFVAQYFSDSVAVVDPRGPGDAAVGTIALGPAPQMTQVRRGQLLFNDATLCFQHWQSCASCHPDGRGDGLNWDLMNDGAGNSKNTKSMLLAHQTPPAMSEGVRMSAEEAVRSGFRHVLFVDRPEEESAAIDAYLKSLRPVPSPRLVDGRLSPAAERGRALFEGRRAGCSRCHPAPLYTDLRSHKVGSRSPVDRTDRFDTPTLVEVWRTAPYLHDGRYTTIKEVLTEGKHGLRRETEHPLGDREIDDLVEFVLSL
jgi:YVTN family beta-propeller protein